MAKGNLFLGFARGSVGDVTLYRAYGEQVSRGRNRHPRNPKTFKQMVQRAVNASVSRLYSLGSPIFDHAFEGRSVGSGNQRRFMQVNMGKLRELLISEFNLPEGDANLQVSRIGAPGLSVAVPFAGLVVSEGSYPQNFFSWEQQGGNWKVPAIPDNSTIASYCAANGLVAGDIFTLGIIVVDKASAPLFVAPGTSADGEGTVIRQPYFFYIQLRVKDTAPTDTTALNDNTSVTDVFDEVLSDPGLDGFSSGRINFNAAINGMSFIGFASNILSEPAGVSFVIRSHDGLGLRSNSRTQAMSNYGANTQWGLTAKFLEAAWMPVSQLNDSDMILDGSEFVD